ncbi:hypothetical protein [Pseudaminobacter sp. NGMCC 1.201702]|uniref:hypothetical protein n=1 Tax=Pseudaminobacter sp. NGMCC 1.201702 TaxID=3391825 RepID=UPI0039EE42A7
MFDFISRTLSTAFDVATLPVAAAADVVTLGGALMDRSEPYTATKVKRVARGVGDVTKALVE